MSQVSFDDTMEKLAELEQFAENYAGNTQGADAKALASCYLFSDRYSGGLWEKVGIRKDADFERYVKEQDAGLSSLKEVETLSVPAGYEVDFLHMAASLYVGDDAGGWIGDLTEFAWELKNNGITEKEDAAARFLSADSYWNEADFYADIDAANMRKTYQRNTLSETLLTYYGKDTDSAEEHLGQFVADRFFADSKEELEQAVFSGYRTHWLTQELLTAFELDASEDQSSLKLASDTMADYLYAHAKLPETKQTETKKEELFEDTEFPYWSEDTAGMVVTDETGQVSGAGLAGIAVLLLVAVFLFIAWNRKK